MTKTAPRGSFRLIPLVAIACLTSPAVLRPPAFAADVAETAQICAGCHGEAGIPQEKTTPVIWGQNEGYLYLQLRDFKSGVRKNDQMSAIVADLEKADLKALAAHFAGLAWPNLQQPSAPNDVAAKAQSVIASIGCSACHLDQFQGNGSTARIAGQQVEYLQKTMSDFRDRSRANNPGMSDLMNAAQPDELTAMAHYLASQQVVGGSDGQ